MSKWLLTLVVAFAGATMVVNDVEAKRLGGGRALGTQRSITNTPPASVPAKPAQQQAAPAQSNAAQQPAAAATAPAASGLSRWMPMLGGLALGGMLGYLFGGSGLGGILLLALLAVVAVLAFRAFAARRREEGGRPMQLAGFDSGTVATPPRTQAAGSERMSDGGGRLPAGFDATGFLKAAKMNFVRLQMANDAGNVEEIREFTTPEMFEELRKDIAGRPSGQQTEVGALDAELLEVATEGNRHWASVRFSGMVSEAQGAPAEPFHEVWNLVKPVDGSSGWLLAGIQQVQ